ncbi:acyl-CoA dehydrogenase [Gordonia amarae]|uniref:glutaryl-CoA dehydrogenase (ETF) n=2 Tax=Gordonia amarae TaxID=36821 RepID=G7GNQ8_9ACTN|nr:acyl-CoA dehydrogenase family protein [Gordonia amarae]MCS3878181.1 glutaryl-CoA dehydrogenase [Gordonia amarae]QHN16849.1 acyl-CoA dehydrogenase [Gordonia amarae]QHN21374.1 acyl-CoA dehydrogenase [Gordonia amarae]QHN30227.1 acyl-CoA dehydrogenase [Gordonia amarae]QHN39001.1 acyl-CoA dehydrogenase [Gordonia amarae]
MGDPLDPTRSDNPRDMLAISTLIGQEEREIQQTVRRFVTDRVLPDIADWFDQGVFPRELAKEMGSLGLLGMHLDGYGCAGTNATSYGLACLELEAGDSGFRSFVSVQGSLAMFPIRAFGSEEQKQEWLPRMAAGEAIGCFGLTEPDSGSDPGSMRTNARRDGGDWVLNGTKMWITNGGIADVAVVWARTDGGVRGFVVPTDTPGFSANNLHKKMSLRASVTSELVLDNVRLPESAVLPGVSGLRGPLSCLNEARFGILFGVVGAARACYEAALDYSITRQQFGKPIAGFQLVQRKLVEMMVSVNRSALVAMHLGRLKDAGQLTPAQVSFGKLDNVRQAIDVAREARNSLGANGITLEYPVIRHMTNLESVYTYEGTNEIHTLALGRAITGEDAYR